MIKFEITEDNKYLKVSDCELRSELKYLKRYFSKKSKEADFNSQVDAGIWDGLDVFLTKDGKISIGLWKEVWNFSKTFDIDVEFDVKPLIDKDFKKQRYEKFVNALYKGILTDKGEPFFPRNYQYEGAFRALKYKFCCEELATSAGKTSIFHIYNSYLKFIKKIDKNNKALIVVPNVDLVKQTEKAFLQYTNGLVEWNIMTVGGKDNFDMKTFEECDMLITTYQSMLNLVPACLESRLETLIMKPLKKQEDRENRAKEITDLKRKIQQTKLWDICSYFKVVNIDEAHKSASNSITNIINSCKNWEYKLGLSGTLNVKEEYSDFFKMQDRVGPLVMTLPAKYLIDNEYSPEIKIKQIYLEYEEGIDPTIDEYLKIQRDKEVREKVKSQFRNPKDFGSRMLEIEKSIIFDSKPRFEFLNRFIKKLGKNTLVLFTDVKNEYGKTIVNNLKEWNDNTFYIDGNVDTDDRAFFKETMEKRDDVIIVASYATFATGIDLKNVHHIVFAESVKAEITIRQAIGRGMRYLKGKDKVIIWDIIDDLSGYSIRHSLERVTIYQKQEFEILQSQRVPLLNFVSD
jgi:superfamily II DNA or RNA helicase